MGSKVSMPAAPAAPAPVDPAKSSIDYINAMADPELQGRILDVESMYRPQYTALELADINTLMQGGNGQKGLLDLTDEATQRSNTLASQQLSQQRAADIADVEALGGRASAAFFNANPQLRAQLEQASASLGQAAALGGERQAQQVGAGDLGNLLMQKAMSQQDLGAVGQTLQDRAQQFAKSTGELSADEIRQLQQSTRAAYAARGREMDTSAIGGEALSRLTNQRNRMLEDLGIASSINQASQAEIGANRGFQQQVQGADIARQGGNAQLAMQQLGLDRQFALQLAQGQQSLASQYQSLASDPFQAILGRPSQSQAAGLGQTQFASGLAGQALGPNLFDPNAGINLGLQNQANQANYASNIYGAQASYAGATNQGRGAMIGGIFSGLGALGGGALIACWVAREVYGVEDVRWLVFREWLLNEAPRWFRHLYLTYGERFAAWVSDKPAIKSVIRSLMNLVVNPRLKLEVA